MLMTKWLTGSVPVTFHRHRLRSWLSLLIASAELFRGEVTEALSAKIARLETEDQQAVGSRNYEHISRGGWGRVSNGLASLQLPQNLFLKINHLFDQSTRFPCPAAGW
jgi:hypothetical protein